MPGNNMLKKEILMQIGNLPDTKMPELLDFIKFLNFQRRTVLKNKSTEGKNLFNFVKWQELSVLFPGFPIP